MNKFFLNKKYKSEMKQKVKFFTLSMSLLILCSCKSKIAAFKASGIFEAKEVIISAEASGRIDELLLEEGTNLLAGQSVGKINCSQQEFITQQANASLQSINSKTADPTANIKVLERQKLVQENQVQILKDQFETILREESRLSKLVQAQAIPAKQLDDLLSTKTVMQKQIESAQQQVSVTEAQIKAARQNTALQNRAILSEKSPLSVRVEQLRDLEKKCEIVNPIKGTVLTQYTNKYEMATPGKALYKIANLDTLYLKAYVTGDQLPEIKLNQELNIHTQQGEHESNFKGILTWISDKAEFTPKSIMTADERSNLVYPIKIKVANDGDLKLGLFAEVNW